MADLGVDVSTQAKELIAERKAQILDKVRKGETEVSIAIGNSSFTETEWDKLMARIDKTLELTKEEQKERFTKQKEELEEQKDVNDLLEEKSLAEELFELRTAESRRRVAKLLE